MTRGRGVPKRSARSAALFWTLAAVLGVVAVRLVWIQVLQAPAFAQMAEDQRTRDIVLSPRRGAIYDRGGEPLAVSMQARTVYASPHLVTDPVGTAKALASVLGGDLKEYEKKLKKDAGFVYIARKVDMDRAQALANLELAGVSMIDDSRRTYPSGELASQVLGFVGVDDEGLAGLERYYDDVLAGKPGRIIAECDRYNRAVPGGVTSEQPPVDGQSVILTLDKDIQYVAQLELSSAVKKWNAKSGSIVVMDPATGEILAMATVPGFNPNAYQKAVPHRTRNRPVTDMYEPGSTIKSFTAAAVIDKGLFVPSSMFKLPPTLKVGGRTIKESHPRGTVNWSLTEIVTNSSNVGSVKLGQALGKNEIYRYFERFGMTERTGVDFPGESPGSLPRPKDWSASSIGNIPFGQGMAVTPLQLARALSVIANGGELVTPHFLYALPEQPDAQLAWPKRRSIPESTTAMTAEILKAVVTEGTGKEASVRGYEVAGKTGTAQKPRKDGKGYKGGGYVASFSGFLPADDPRIVVVVILDEPRDSIYGGVVAAPTFSRVASFCMSHLKVPPTSTDATLSIGPVSDGDDVGQGEAP